MSLRGQGRPSASSSRSARGRAGSCQGKSSSTSAGAAASVAPLPLPLPWAWLPPASRPSRPAKKPLSQARWAGENGAVSGSTGTVIEPQPGRVFRGANMSLSWSVEYRLVNSCNDSWGPARGQVATEHPLDDLGRVLGPHLAVDLAADVLVRPVAAAEEDVISLHHVVTLGNLGPQQADVTDVVLGA